MENNRRKRRAPAIVNKVFLWIFLLLTLLSYRRSAAAFEQLDF